MNHFRKIACLILFLTALFCMVLPVAADSSDDVEVVLLFDVSGSMARYSDPLTESGSRLSIEAAQQFVFNCSPQTNMYVKVIPYHHEICTSLDKVNVAEESGLGTYIQYMQNILSDKNDKDNVNNEDLVPGIACWNYVSYTDIGLALENAVNAIVGSSNCEKKVVILFTDGKIDLKEGEAAEAVSEQKAFDSADALAEAGVQLYSIGLDAGGKGNIDKSFLAKLHKVDSVDKTNNIKIVENANQLADVFSEIYTYLFDNTMLDEDVEDFSVSPDEETERVINIYANAVKEANISLSSAARLKTIKVLNPAGVTVADIDLDNPGKNKIDKEKCVVNYTGMAHSATIKLLAPEGGDWKVLVKGEESTVIERKIYLFDLVVRDNIPSENVYVGNKFVFESTIYNSENNIHLDSPGLYSADEGASSTVVYQLVGGGNEKTVNGTLNKNSNGYVYELEFKDPGEYVLKTTLVHSQYRINGTDKKITVVGPNLVVSAVNDPDVEGDPDVSLRFVNPVKGETVDTIPSYIMGQNMTLVVSKDGEEIERIDIDMNKFENGEYVHSYIPATVGKYTFKAEIGHLDVVAVESEAVEIDFLASQISMNGNIINKIEKSAFSGGFQKIIDLTGIFADSDGDALTYTVKTEGDSSITASISGEKLTIKSDDFGNAVISLVVSDGNGAERVCTITVSIKSLVPVLMTIIIVVVALAVIAVLAILFINHKKIISMAFKIRVEKVNPETYQTTEVVYSVPRLSGKKNAKPSMTLKTILTTRGYSSPLYGTMDGADIQNFIENYSEHISLTGVPFKKAFKIVSKDPVNKKKAPRVTVFKSANMQVRTPDGSYTVIFGNSHAFQQTETLY